MHSGNACICRIGGGIAGGKQNGTLDQPVCLTKAYNCLIGWNRSTYGGGAGAAPTPSTVVGFAPNAFVIQFKSPCRNAGLTLPGQRDETDLL